MKLKLKSIREIKDVSYIKKYEYDDFDIKVSIDSDEKYIITADSKSNTLEIFANEQYEPSLSIEMTTLKSGEIDNFIKNVKCAKEMMDEINLNIKELIKKE